MLSTEQGLNLWVSWGPSLCVCAGVSSGTQVSSHSPKTRSLVICLYVSLWRCWVFNISPTVQTVLMVLT